MAMDLNASNTTKKDAFEMSPRRILALWRNWQAFRPDLERRQAIVGRAAAADEKGFKKWFEDRK